MENSELDREYYIKKGFEPYAIMTPSDKYTQGIELWYPSKPIKSDNQPAVYILTNKEGKLLKIGETQNYYGIQVSQSNQITSQPFTY